jgi:large subunit ribosomal protein L24
MSIKRGDNVVVISGKDKGKKGKVVRVDEEERSTRVVVDGVNIVTKHKKARTSKEKSKRESKAAPIDVSNVMILCKCGKATRTKYKIENGKKIRVCSKCGEVLDKKYVKIKEKAKEGTEIAEKEDEKGEKKPLQRREIKTQAESKVKKHSDTVKSTGHRQIGGA